MTDFETTQWSWLTDLQTTSEERLDAWARLYRNPMVHFLMRKGIREDDAEDFVQGFLLRLVTDRQFFTQVDRGRGRFRDYLRASLLNFVRDKVRRSRTRQRHPGAGRLKALGEIDLSAVAVPDPQADRTFERTVALDRFVEAVWAWKPECQSRDPRRWEVFRQRFLIPFVRRTPPPSYKDFYRTLGFSHWKQAANCRPYIISGIKAKLRQVVHGHLVRSVDVASTRERVFQEIWHEQFDGRPLTDSERTVLERCAQQECAKSVAAMVDAEVKQLIAVLRAEVSGEQDDLSPHRTETGAPDTSVEYISRGTAKLLDGMLDRCDDAQDRCTGHYDLATVASFWLEDELSGRPHRDWCQTMRVSFKRKLAEPIDLVPAAVTNPQRSVPLHDLTIRSLADVLRHPQPPIELLRLVKEYAQAECARSDSSPQQQMFTAIYFASVVAAQVRSGVSISRLSERKLQRGVHWTAEQDWVDQPTKSLMQAWLAKQISEFPPCGSAS